jgi:hypothetical protein
MSASGDNKLFERMVDRVLAYRPKKKRKKKSAPSKKAKKGTAHP